MKRIYLVLTLLLSIVFLLVFSYGNYNVAGNPFHSPAELEYFSSHSMTGPLVPGEWFLPSTSCRGCHGYDSLQQANIDEDGNDVNLVRHWETSMMALAAKDPLWRAKVTQEILVNPAIEGALQDKCTSCHAPAGRYNHYFKGLGPFRLSDLYNDSLGLDGVNCSGCHTIGTGAGQTFSGNIPYDTTRHIYGPFQNPMAGPMQLYEGYTPTYSAHTDQSSFCASCHTLITETVDLAGNFTGGEFVEQATFHEYKNSSFQANNIKCQTCHMPQLESAIVIANGYIALAPRFPFNQHTFAGANTFMLKLMRSNRGALGINAPLASFDTTIEATTKLLRQQSVDMSLLFDSVASDTGYFRVRIQNKAGHKFPSGYPARRAVLQFVVRDVNGDTLFRSGTFDQEYRVTGETPGCERHHDVINQNNQSQIYELVMGDVNNNFTSVLARAANLLKDNRIPPDGFTTQHYAYDTTRISADALADPDFNKAGSVEGTAVDYVHFHIPLNAANGQLTVSSQIYYQSVPPKWLDEMFQLNHATIDTFRTMYNAADKTPLLIASDSITITATGMHVITSDEGIRISPNASSGYYTVQAAATVQIKEIVVYNQKGQIVVSKIATDTNSLPFDLNAFTSGIYYVKVITNQSDIIKKIIKF